MLVLAQKVGRLGNRLSLFAHLIACAREFDLRLMNFAFFEYARLFASTCDSTVPSFPERGRGHRALWSRSLLYQLVNTPTRIATSLGLTETPIQIIHLKGGRPFDLANEEFIQTARKRRLVVLRGWGFRCHDMVTRHADAIREYFRPALRYRKNIDRSLIDASKNTDVMVGVHIRQGDYASFQGGKFFYAQSVYCEKMKQLEALLSPQRVGFLVCSDGHPDPDGWDGLRVSSGPGHMVEDMFALARCDLLMGPLSTFSHWSSFYGNVPLWQIHDANDQVSLAAFAPFNTL